jgi:hypothetical protein
LVIGPSTKRPSTLSGICILFYLQPDQKKKIGHELFFFPAVTQKLQFSNFKATVIPISLVILLVLEVFIILVKSATLSKLSDVPTFYKFPGKTFSK